MAIRVYVLDGGGPKDSENTLNSFWTKNKDKVFWQIGAEMFILLIRWMENGIVQNTKIKDKIWTYHSKCVLPLEGQHNSPIYDEGQTKSAKFLFLN